MSDVLIVFGTASNVGKSWLCTGLCAAARARGIAVAPFKARNLSNNAAPARTPDGAWGEVGRAQAAQAEAAGLAPTTDMNPILLKAGGATGTQLIVHGRPEPLASLTPARAHAVATAALDQLLDAHELVVVEGAGSPVELNLQDRDLANVPIARHAIRAAAGRGGRARILVVADISEGGVFASVLGTLALLPEDLRRAVAGVVINRFQGEPRYFAPGPALLAERAGVPVLGVVPDRPDIHVDAEDLVDAPDRAGAGPLDVCVLRLPTVASFDDLAALARVDGLSVRFVDEAEAVGWPDLLVLPGARDPLAERVWLAERGLDTVVVALARAGVPILGICGGYQLLGERLDDADGAAGSRGERAGLGLLPVETRFRAEKTVQPARGETTGHWLLPEGLAVSGYEIHHGQSHGTAPPLLTLDGRPEGAVQGSVAGSYLHGLLDEAPVREALVGALSQRRGLPAVGASPGGAAAARSAGHDALIALLENHLDLDALL